MAKAGLTLANPRLSGMNTQTSLVGDYTLSVPRYAPPADTSVAEAGGQMLKTASLMGQMSEPTYGSSVKIDPTQNKVSVGGVAFDMDDYAQAVGTESLIGQPTVDATEGNWIDLDEGSWRQYVEGIKNPSTAERAKRNWEVGVANYLGTLGGLAQLVGAEEYGANLVLEQERVKQKLAPFVQEFTKVGNPEEAGAAIVGTLAQQGPNAIDAILFGAAGALLGTATGGPAAALGGAAASLAGRQALKKAMVTAAEKYVAKQPLNKLDKAALRAAKQMSDVAGLSTGRATAPTADAVLKLAKRQAAMGGALAGAAVGSYKSALGEVYGEFRQQGAGPEDMGARLGAAAAAVPFGALDFAGDVVIGGLGTSLLKGGAKTAYKELSLLGKGKEALRRGAKGAAIATPVGGATEAGQEAILIGATGQDFSDPKNLTRLLESFIAGGVGEGTVGGIANIVGPVDAMKREALPNPNATPVGTAAEPEAPTAPPAAPVPPTGGPMSYGALPPQESVPPALPTPTAEVEPPAPVGPTVTMQSDTNVKGSKGNTRTITMSTGATYTIKRDKTGWRLVAEDGTETDLGTKAKPEAITKIIELETERQRSLPPKPAPLSTVVSDEPVVGAALTRRKVTMSNGIAVTIEKARGGWNLLDEDGNPGEFLGTKKEDALAALEQLAVGGIAPGTVNPRLAPLQQELARIDASIYAINSQLTAIDTGRVTATPEERQALETQKAQAFRMRDYVQQGITTADVGVMRPDFPSADQLFNEATQVVLNGTVKPDAKSIANALLVDEKVAADLIKQMVDKKILVGLKGKYKINENIPEEMRMEIGQGRETTALGQKYEQSPELSTAVGKEDLAGILNVLDTNENPTIRDVAKRARYLIGKVRIKMVSDGSIGANVLGRYFYGGARIGDLELTTTGSLSPWVVAHELVHALTSTYIDQRPNSAAVKRMDALYKYVKSLAAFDAYGFKNMQEFVAEGIANPEFQTKLMQVRYRGPSLWSRFARAVADILGIKYNTAFTELLTIYGDMATQQELEIDTLLAANRGRSRGIGVAKLKGASQVRVTRDELQRLKKGAQQEGVSKYPEGRGRLAKNRQDRNVAPQDQGAGGEAGDTGGVQQGGRVQVPEQDKIGLATGVPPSEFVPRFAPSKVEQLISKLPLPLQDPLLAITDSFGNLGPRLVAKLGMGNQLLDAAVRYNIPSARKYARLTRERGAIVERKQEAYVRWAEAHNKLPAQYRGTGEGTTNGLIQRMTQEDKWAFIPNYFRGEDKDASIILDQELAAEFNAMPREAQAVVVEAFRLNYDTLKDSQQSVLEMTASEYDALIANATSEKDRAAYEKAKADSLKQYERLLRIDPTTPYAPLSRYGKWVVIGKSDAFIAAQEADNRTEIERLQSDPNHYFVDYADTRAEAARMQREIINTYGGDPRNAQIAQRSDAEESMYGGRDMMYAFQRLNSMIERESMSPEIAKQLRKRVVEMQLMAMANTSARKAELRRKNIASGDLDMVQIILSRGRATAHFIGSVHKNKEIVDAIGDMRKEVKVNDGKREERQAIYNGILARYVDGMTTVPENSLSDNMTSLTSFWMLGLAPSYYLQQAMQNMMITLPFIASRHGYDETFAAMRAGYKQVMKAWSDGGVLDQLDINKVDPKYRALANYLAESGELDVGINKEMGTLTADSGGAISNTMKRVTDSVRALTRKIEAINRLSAGIAMYELELAADRKGKTLERSYDTGAYQSYLNDFAKAHPLDTPLTETQFAAANNALRVVTDTHGNYGYENTPVFLRGPVARVVGQFQKFRIILAGLYIREINNWLRGTSPEDRAVARRAVLYMSGHAAIAGGLLGSPVAAVFALVYNAFAGSEDEREDMEKDIRQAIGDPTIANLLLKGLPTLAGVDMSGTLGQGTILSVAPYTDLPTDRDSYAKYILSLTGPAIGGIGGNLFDAVSLASDGNYYKAMEKVMPRGVGGAMRSLREALGGETNTANELLVSPVELSAVESFWGTIGFQPIDRANRQFTRNQFFKDQKFYQDRVSDVKRAYVVAFRAKDTEKMQQLRGEWKQLQQVREQRGLKPQPLMQLLNAPREVARQEQRTVGGLQFGPSTERQARELAGLAGG